MRMRKSFLVMALCCISVLASLSSVKASQLVYVPINPSFGGNPYNASWLLSSAQAQNTLKDKTSISSSSTEGTLKNFSDNLNRQILSRLSSQLIQNAFGARTIQPGHYEIGGFIIDITENVNSIGVEISDPATGAQTVVEIPYYD